MSIKYFPLGLTIYFILICNAYSHENRRNIREIFESVSYEYGTQKFYSNIIVHNYIKGFYSYILNA